MSDKPSILSSLQRGAILVWGWYTRIGAGPVVEPCTDSDDGAVFGPYVLENNVATAASEQEALGLRNRLTALGGARFGESKFILHDPEKQRRILEEVEADWH